MEGKIETRGRKKAIDPKVSLRVYVNQSKLDKMGGLTEAHRLVLRYIEKYRRRIK